MKKFNNRPNPEHHINGKTIWESRSVAVVGVVLGIWESNVYVLLEKRSDIIMDSPGKWCLPCGYLDWDETAQEGLKREIYEETGLDIDTMEDDMVFENKQPFLVNTDPSENRQNITLSYINAFDFFKTGLPELKIMDLNETSELRWVSIEYLSNFDLAFNHQNTISKALAVLEEQ